MPSQLNSRTSPPAADTIEVSLIGPGYGEAALIHLGDGKWIAVDSCEGEASGSCAPLDYLREIGVDPDKQLLAVIISHWDDDHIRGVSQLVTAAKAAKVVISAATKREDFLELAHLFQTDRTRLGRTGVDEIVRVYDALAATRRGIWNAIQHREVILPGLQGLSHGQPVTLRTLSPADAEFNNFIAWVATQMPSVGSAKGRFPRRERNDLSVVLTVSVGNDTILLGGDLEEEGKPDTGWTALLASKEGGTWDRASVYKVAHHGSHTGHHDGVWSEMLTDEPVALLAPWINGGNLVPSAAERQVVLTKTPEAYATAVVRYRRAPDRGRAAAKTIAQSVANYRSNKPLLGQVRLRKTPTDSGWAVELFGEALHLGSWPPSPQVAGGGSRKAR